MLLLGPVQALLWLWAPSLAGPLLLWQRPWPSELGSLLSETQALRNLETLGKAKHNQSKVENHICFSDTKCWLSTDSVHDSLSGVYDFMAVLYKASRFVSSLGSSGALKLQYLCEQLSWYAV